VYMPMTAVEWYISADVLHAFSLCIRYPCVPISTTYENGYIRLHFKHRISL